jgi:hypothetical protein
MKRLLLATLLSTNSYGVMIQSQHETVTDNYPETVKPAIYKVLKPTKIRDFPSMQGKVTGYLGKDDLIEGHEIEGCWLTIFDNEYVSLKYLKKVKE